MLVFLVVVHKSILGLLAFLGLRIGTGEWGTSWLCLFVKLKSRYSQVHTWASRSLSGSCTKLKVDFYLKVCRRSVEKDGDVGGVLLNFPYCTVCVELSPGGHISRGKLSRFPTRSPSADGDYETVSRREENKLQIEFEKRSVISANYLCACDHKVCLQRFA